MRLLILVSILQLGLASAALALQDGAIVTDRPDFTESAETVSPRRLQWESGYTFTRDGSVDEHALGEVLLRYGIVERLEARLGLESHVWTEGEDGFEDPIVGVKIRLAEGPEEPGWRPGVAILAGSAVPGFDDFGEGEWQPEAVLSLAWDAGAASLGSNLGVVHASESGERFEQALASLALGFGISSRAGGYLEAYALAPAGPDDDDAAVFNGGVTFLVHDDFQLDARIGAGLTSVAPDFFAGIGLARRW